MYFEAQCAVLALQRVTYRTGDWHTAGTGQSWLYMQTTLSSVPHSVLTANDKWKRQSHHLYHRSGHPLMLPSHLRSGHPLMLPSQLRSRHPLMLPFSHTGQGSRARAMQLAVLKQWAQRPQAPCPVLLQAYCLCLSASPKDMPAGCTTVVKVARTKLHSGALESHRKHCCWVLLDLSTLW